MLNVYKKVEKSNQILSGFVEVTDNFSLDRPLLLCLSAQDTHDKSLYGIVREGAQGARVYTTEENAAGFKIDEMPIDFLGVRWRADENYREKHLELVDRFIFPYLTKNNTLFDFDIIKARANKINFLTYCNGTITYEKIEHALEKRLSDMGFDTSQVNAILSQLSLVAIGTEVDISQFRGMCCAFVDVNDNEIYNDETDNYRRLLYDKNKKSTFLNLNQANKNFMYIYEGTGDHSLKEYLRDSTLVKPVLCRILSRYIIQSLENGYSNVNEKASEILSDVPHFIDESVSPEQLLSELDNSLEYGVTPRYTPEVMEIKRSLDAAYSELLATKRKLESELNQHIHTKEKVNKLIQSIQYHSSDVGFEQIVTKAGVWNASRNFDLNQPTDREIRRIFDESFNNVPEMEDKGISKK